MWWTRALLALGLSACAPEAEPVRSTTAPIANGALAPSCAFPTAVALRSPSALCSGVLIHPEIIAYAAHCGTGFTRAQFGETAPYPRVETIRSCAAHPDYELRSFAIWDYAFCRLDRPVNDIPIVPPIAGCEMNEVVAGRPSVVVGFGDTEASGTEFGDKRWYAATLGRSFGDERPGGQHLSSLTYSPDVSEVCSGDSGGPTYFQLSDGTWRVLGLHSTASPGCGGPGNSVQDSLIHIALPWIERESGVDVTPCHSDLGASCTFAPNDCTTAARFTPGPECGPFPTDIGTGTGSWPGCAAPTAATSATGCSAMDAGAMDAGVTDAGVTDAGAAPADAGLASTDAGATTPEAGSGLFDAGLGDDDSGADDGDAAAAGEDAGSVGSSGESLSGGCRVTSEPSGAALLTWAWACLLIARLRRRRTR